MPALRKVLLTVASDEHPGDLLEHLSLLVNGSPGFDLVSMEELPNIPRPTPAPEPAQEETSGPEGSDREGQEDNP